MSKRNVPDYEQYEDAPQEEGMSKTEQEDESPSASQQESFSDSELEEREEENNPLLNRETKIGLAVVLVLVIVLGVLLVKRFSGVRTNEESKQATAKAESKSPETASSGSLGSQRGMPVPKPTGQPGAGSSPRLAPPAESSPWIPSSSWSSSGGTPGALGSGKSPPENKEPTAGSFQLSPGLASEKPSEVGRNPASQGLTGQPSQGSSPRSPNPPTAFGHKNSSGTGESVFSGGNPLRADSPAPPAQLNTASQQGDGSLSGSLSRGIAAHTPNTERHSDQQDGGTQENRPAFSKNPLSSGGDFSPYTPPSLGAEVSPAGTREPTRSSSPGASGTENPPVVLASPGSHRGRNPEAPAGHGQATAGWPRSSGSSTDWPPSPRSYLVQAGDTYWTISEKWYGTGSYYQALAEYNRSRIPQPEQLRMGDFIILPDRAELQRLYPHLCPVDAAPQAGSGTPERVPGAGPAMTPGAGPAKPQPPGSAWSFSDRPETGPASIPSAKIYRVYIVQDGDTIYEIARYLLGKPSRWVEIYELNKETLGEDMEHLRPGTRLIIPPAEPAGSMGPMSAAPGRPLPKY